MMISRYIKGCFTIFLALAGQQLSAMAAPAILISVPEEASAQELQFIELCKFGRLAAVQEMLKKYSGININVHGGGSGSEYFGETALICASRYGHLDTVQFLIEECGANIHAPDICGGRPLYWAARWGHAEIAKYLAAHGATLTKTSRWGSTELHGAAFKNSLEMARLFVAMGADVNAKDEHANTSLHVAASSADLEFVHYLYDCGAQINAKNDFGETPLYRATRVNKPAIAKFLLEKGARVNEFEKFGWTPLHSAARDNLQDLAKLLLAHGANVNSAIEGRVTPLWEAMLADHLEMMEFLIKNGADVNVKSSFDLTILHTAACGSSPSKPQHIKLLLENGADATATNHLGDTPLVFAFVESSPLEVVQLLVAKGASLYTKNTQGKTPLDYARRRKQLPDVVEYLAHEVAKKSTLHALLACEELINPPHGTNNEFPPELIGRVLNPCIVAAEMAE